MCGRNAPVLPQICPRFDSGLFDLLQDKLNRGTYALIWGIFAIWQKKRFLLSAHYYLQTSLRPIGFQWGSLRTFVSGMQSGIFWSEQCS